VVSRDCLDRMKKGLGHRVVEGRCGRLVWGIVPLVKR
jgi:hypothetical protein